MIKFIKRTLVFLGAVTFLLLLLFGAGIVYWLYIGYSLGPSGKAYADECIQAIVHTWSEDELVKRSSPELRAGATQGQLDQVFVTLNKLGKLKSYEGAQGKVALTFDSKKGFVITAPYRAMATFQNETVEINLTLIRHNNLWQISGFHVDKPPFFTPWKSTFNQ